MKILQPILFLLSQHKNIQYDLYHNLHRNKNIFKEIAQERRKRGQRVADSEKMGGNTWKAKLGFSDKMAGQDLVKNKSSSRLLVSIQNRVILISARGIM